MNDRPALKAGVPARIVIGVCPHCGKWSHTSKLNHWCEPRLDFVSGGLQPVRFMAEDDQLRQQAEERVRNRTPTDAGSLRK